MIYVKINETLYPASINGKMHDKDWDNRPSKTITLAMTYEEAIALFVDGIQWSIVQVHPATEPLIDENGHTKLDEYGNAMWSDEERIEEYDNSEYSIAGPITDYRDGTVAITMGKLTELEEAYELLLGGI